MTVSRRIRLAARKWHCLLARSEAATRAYIPVVSTVARLTPSKRLRTMIRWAVTGQNIPWKPLAFAPHRVTAGNHTAIRLYPHLGEFDQAALFSRRLDYEPAEFVWLEDHAASRYDAIVEIGANVGLYSVFFDALARASEGGRLRRIYSFEPSLPAYRRLLANLAINKATTVEPFTVAISDRTGFADFYHPEGHLMNGSLFREFASVFAENVESSSIVCLAGMELAALFERHHRVLLKIDAEGAGRNIVSSMAPIIERHRPDLLIEVLDGADAELRELEVLAPYACFGFANCGPVRRDHLFADPLCFDWLLTMSPQDIG